MTRECYDPATREWVSPDEYARRKASRTTKPKANWAIPTPYAIGDLPEYVSPVTGKPIAGRVARREDLKRSGCREVDPSEFKPKYVNRQFAEKRGLPVAEE